MGFRRPWHHHRRAGSWRSAASGLARCALEGHLAAGFRFGVVLCDDRCPERSNGPLLCRAPPSALGRGCGPGRPVRSQRCGGLERDVCCGRKSYPDGDGRKLLRSEPARAGGHGDGGGARAALSDQASAVPSTLRAGRDCILHCYPAHRCPRLARHSARESWRIRSGLVTAAVVVLVGVEQGILLAMVLSLLRIVRHSYRPHTGVLVGDKEEAWHRVPAAPGAVTEPGLVIYRFGAALFYANASLFAKEVRGLVGPVPSSVRWLVVDAEAITNVDYTAARMIRQLHDELVRRGVLLAFARVSSSLKADLDRHRLTEVLGPARLFDRLHDALATFERWREPASQAERDSRHERQ